MAGDHGPAQGPRPDPRDAALATKLATLHADADPARRTEPVPEHEHIPDDRLQLMFACCHPALDLDAQTGLTLRYIAGLSTAEIAQAFLVPPATMAHRLTPATPPPSEAPPHSTS